MIKTMITMCRLEKTNEENLLADKVFFEYIKKDFPKAKITPSFGFWKESNVNDIFLEPGFTITNLKPKQLEKLKEIVANPSKIGLDGHAQQGFIEIIDNKINTYRLENDHFEKCTGRHPLDWGQDLEYQIEVPINFCRCLADKEHGGTIVNNSIICCTNKKDYIELSNKLESKDFESGNIFEKSLNDIQSDDSFKNYLSEINKINKKISIDIKSKDFTIN